MLRNTIVSLPDATAALAMANPTVALAGLSFELVMLTQKLPDIVPPHELSNNSFAHSSSAIPKSTQQTKVLRVGLGGSRLVFDPERGLQVGEFRLCIGAFRYRIGKLSGCGCRRGIGPSLLRGCEAVGGCFRKLVALSKAVDFLLILRQQCWDRAVQIVPLGCCISFLGISRLRKILYLAGQSLGSVVSRFIIAFVERVLSGLDGGLDILGLVGHVLISLVGHGRISRLGALDSSVSVGFVGIAAGGEKHQSRQDDCSYQLGFHNFRSRVFLF